MDARLMFVGRAAGDSAVHALNAGVSAGWVSAGGLVPEVGTLKQLFHTAGFIHDSAGIVRIGDPLQPLQELEAALLEAPQGVRLVGVAPVTSEWAWAAEADEVQTSVVLDEIAFQDCRGALEDLGLFPQVVPSAMSLPNRIRLAGNSGSIIVEASRIPQGWHALPSTDAIQRRGPLWYGLVRRAEPVEVLGAGTIAWLAFSPRFERAGGLREVLEVFTACRIDLKHLRSFPRMDGTYAFACTFRVEHELPQQEIFSRLEAQQTDYRLLAAFEAPAMETRAEALEPVWESGTAPAVAS